MPSGYWVEAQDPQWYGPATVSPQLEAAFQDVENVAGPSRPLRFGYVLSLP